MIRKHISAVLVGLLVCAALLCGCAVKMTDDEARSLLAELIPRSQEINGIFFGEGLPVEEDTASESGSADGARYCPVTKDCPYQSVAQIRAAAEKVYTREYLQNSVYPMAFDGVEEYEPRYKEIDGVLCRNVSATVFEIGETDSTSARVVGSGFGVVEVEMDYSRGGSVKISLREQDGVWLLDGPTY